MYAYDIVEFCVKVSDDIGRGNTLTNGRHIYIRGIILLNGKNDKTLITFTSGYISRV